MHTRDRRSDARACRSRHTGRRLAWVIRTWVTVAVCAVLALTGGCTSDRATPADEAASSSSTTARNQRSDVWSVLRRRPVELRALRPGSTCPRSTAKTKPPGLAPVGGEGPLYAALLDPVARLRRTADGWYAGKVLWVADPVDPGPYLVRGGRLDDTGALRFEQGHSPESELRLTAAGTARSPGVPWLQWPSTIRVRSHGCYSFQINFMDGDRVVSTHIVFAA